MRMNRKALSICAVLAIFVVIGIIAFSPRDTVYLSGFRFDQEDYECLGGLEVRRETWRHETVDESWGFEFVGRELDFETQKGSLSIDIKVLQDRSDEHVLALERSTRGRFSNITVFRRAKVLPSADRSFVISGFCFFSVDNIVCVLSENRRRNEKSAVVIEELAAQMIAQIRRQNSSPQIS
jgi:hypothetical protein